MRSLHLLLTLIAAAGLVVPVPAAVTNYVTSLEDSGPGSLRQAITEGPSGGTIKFSTNGAITLTSGELFINKNLTDGLSSLR